MSEERVELLLGALNSAPAEPDPVFVARLAHLVYAEATAGAGSSIAPTNEYVGEPTMIDLERNTTEHPRTRHLSTAITRWVAAIVLVVGIGGAVFFATRDDPLGNIAGSSPQAVVDQYFASFNAGDADAVISLVAPDATIAERFGSRGDFEPSDRLDWDQNLAEFLAQGTHLESISCAEVDDPGASGTVLSCDYGILDAPTQAVGAIPVPVTIRFLVTPLGKIGQIQATYDPADTSIDFIHVGRPFGQWLQANRPDFSGLAITDGAVPNCCESMSPTERGALVARYAREWATYLEANDCTYLDGC